MTAIGQCVFCPHCGSLLPRSYVVHATLRCRTCQASVVDPTDKVIISQSKPSAFPSQLRQKRSAINEVTQEERETDAWMDVTCEKCGRERVKYYTQQLRSADEGSTVFYTCECGNKWTLNN